ncbi:glycosyltransferase family 4 protein [Chitinophaga ginsengisegetis]|uniref:glycosyltransferase family 4 protein n=1 Tax=Chitinophaga ginsengisegetis TaxID=393003 RepID=UPI000DBACA28|nr:glycosyltransferase family 4 protein [Chitinophaga ginsengisegetis]MDR6566552.1 glycosyltransferase involved in cell wall biosynthesis [Chitinophaga ginsengisegetis]MDR6646282.1 glycosyltransferase involved in cell wall biosynthesis [Chitinophaga ginsengisegetis]MDR6651125.1 glycosyltransferase involved in cell wall biosynthesis [Chitinophaga ginsengisegetis]
MKLNKKVLIWNDYELSPRKGGPATYLWHLKEFINKNKIQGITFLDNYKETGNNLSNPVTSSKHRFSLLKKLIGNRLKRNLNLLKIVSGKAPEISKPGINIHDYDIIHFHSSLSLKQNIGTLRGVKSQILLTSHSPKVMHKEIIEDWCKMQIDDVLPFVYSFCEKVDVDAFTRADWVIFPCKEAQEPYYNTWSRYAEIIANKKLLFLPTGITPAKEHESTSEVRRKYGIPESAVVFCYAGRHNSIKGYDLLKEAAEVILKNEKNVYFLIAGAPGVIEPILHERWIEVGWTNDPHSIINAADCFILPNRETYFDLILLEVLSLGKNVILSETGGNKYFRQFDSPGIRFFEGSNVSSLIKQLEEFNATVNISRLNGKENLEIFNTSFTQKAFGERYMELYNQIQ